ncbi:MAG: pectin acetylesterase-family hydrolase, partial [Sandaracinaceae bacterium]
MTFSHARAASLLFLLTLGASACGSGPARRDAGAPPDDAGAPPDDAAVTSDAAVDAGPVLDAGPPRPEANIREALGCASPNPVQGSTRPGSLELHEVDTTTFPDALCNDGTPAVLYFRPYRGEANRNRWVVSLRGGGGCGNGDACAGRWCGCGNPGARDCPFTDFDTNFNANNMSGGGSRSQDGGGVQRRDGDPNPLADFNHVQLIYCSSDGWAGGARGVTYTVTHPVTGAEVTYTMHFLGARILDADLAILRQDGVPPLTYTADGGAVEMPDLDEAEAVVFVGDSGGGSGMISNLDRMADLLREHHVGGGAPDMVGIIDAIVGPDWGRLDWTNNPAASAGILTYQDAMAAM